jgi:glyoxylate reductase
MKPRIFVTRRLPQPVLHRLEEVFEVKINPEDRVLTKEEIIEGVIRCDILLCLLTDTIDAEIIEVNKNLKGISNYAVGFNNIDMKTATKRGIPVCNTPEVLTETTADMTWALLLSVARRIVESDKFNRTGKFKGWGPLLLLGNDIFNKTLGIIGAGRIGTAVAQRAVGFKMKILYTDKYSNTELENTMNAKKVDLQTLLKKSDFISIHVPLNLETTNLISKKELQLMKNSAYLINTSRGKVVDEKILVKALKEGWIAGAALDVYYDEPLMAPGLAECENTVLTPHTASASIETRTKMGLLAAENAIDLIQGRKPKEIVNPEVLK